MRNPLFDGDSVIFFLRKVRLFSVHSQRNDGVGSTAHGVGHEEFSLAGIVVRLKNDAAAPENRIVLYHLMRQFEHPIGFIERFAHYPRHVIDRHLGVGQFVANTKVDGVHFDTHHSLHGSLDEVLRLIEHQTHHQL